MFLELNGKSYLKEEIIQRSFPDDLTEYERNILDFCSSWLNHEQETYVLNTSGSTGIPKPIEISRQQMITSARMTQAALGLKENDHAFVCLNTEFIAGKMMLVRSMEIGMRLTILNPTSNPLLNLSPDQKIDFTAMAPLQMENILNDTPDKVSILNQMKAILVGGAPVSYALEEKIQRITSPVFLTFGMTETVSHIALRRLNGENKQLYFQGLQNVSFESDTRGCLVIHSPLTLEPVVSNDLAELIGNDKFIWKGRIDHVINSGGVKVNPETVERKLEILFKQFPFNINYFVAGLPDERLGQKVCLVVEEQKLTSEEKEKIASLIPQKSWGYESPKECIFIDRFSLTSTGKINKPETLKRLQEKLS